MSDLYKNMHDNKKYIESENQYINPKLKSIYLEREKLLESVKASLKQKFNS